MITIIDYGMGNLGSIRNMIKKVGYQSEITSDPEVIVQAEKLILPGVGKFDRAMGNLADLNLIELIKKKAEEGTPLLGICLGMQLLADSSEEGTLKGLGIIPGEVKRFVVPQELKVPHMGWNLVHYRKDSPLFANFEELDEARFYFVHSYKYVCQNEEHILATTNYGGEFTCAVHKGNIRGVQFHPEKSHLFGMNLFKNFLEKI